MASTAQGAFQGLVKEHLAPAFRSRGFKGSASTYELPDPKVWAMLGLQKSRTSTAILVRFTVNLLVAEKASWAAAQTEVTGPESKPNPNAGYFGAVWQTRLGSLLVPPRDWWTVAADVQLDDIAADVLAEVDAVGLPAMKTEMQRAAAST